MNKKEIVVVIIFIILAFGTGMIIGGKMAIEWGVHVGLGLLRESGYDLDVAAEEIVDAVYKYKSKINDKYAFIPSD